MKRQKSFLNLKKVGRKPKVDKGIRHTKRERFFQNSSLHLTIKVRKTSAEIKSKAILKILHYAIMRARRKGLKVIHYTLEHDHVHLLVEARNNRLLHKGMQSFGITFAKNINRIKQGKGTVYKNRYHLRILKTAREVKTVMNYIFTNGIKHGRTSCAIDPYNSMIKEDLIPADIKLIRDRILKFSPFMQGLREELAEILDPGTVHFKQIRYLIAKDRSATV